MPILGIGLVFAASRLVLEQPPYCAPRCDPSNLNALDRRTAGSWRPAWQHVSNAGIAALAGGAALVLLLDEGFLNAVNDGVVIAEAALAAMATTSIMTLAAGRPRPFVYGEQAPLSERNTLRRQLLVSQQPRRHRVRDGHRPVHDQPPPCTRSADCRS